MTINLHVPETTRELKPRIVVVGVGGAGGNAVNNMIAANLEGVEFLACNTDAQSLTMSKADRRIQLGLNVTQGLGAGSRPDIGRAAAEEGLEEILDYLEGAHMAFVTAGMGGGTGTGGAPVIARTARERGILTVGVVTKPFHFEGQHRMKIAESGIEELQQYVDTLIIIPNQNLFRVANEKTTFADAFKMADDVLYSGVRGVTDLMVMPGLINLDFADIRAVMSEMGKAMMGTGEASGERRALDAAEAAISNPLLDDVSMKGAKGVLINITGGMDMTLFEVDEAANRIRDEVDPEANIIFGSTFDEALQGKVRISVVATGIDSALMHQTKPLTRPVLVAERPAPRLVTPAAPAPAPMAAPAAAAPAPQPAPAPMPAPMPASAAAPAPMPVRAAAQPMPARTPTPIARAVAAAMPSIATPTRAPVPEPTHAEPFFMAPRPAEPETPAPTAAAPAPAVADPYAAAAMANGAAAPAEPVAETPRMPRGGMAGLFKKVTGGARKPVEIAPEPIAPVQQRLGGLDPADRPALAKGEDDVLEIPAFLRRQAN
ncbi:MAG TPA: cell division protein FtsZ [Alphaproteobacteria bacterium]|nr:cell division protein FtsZ [Alphaproteobacteria bacterium]